MTNYTQGSNSVDTDLIMQIPGILYWKDRDCIYQGINKVTMEAIGLNSYSEIIGKSDYDLFKDPIAEDYQNQDRFSFEGKEQFNLDTPYRKDGSKVVFLIKKVPFYKKDKIIGVIGNGFELTQNNYKNLIPLLTMAGLKFSDFIFTEKEQDCKTYSYGNIRFSRREAQLLSHMLKGKTALQIGETLGISKRTVEEYFGNIKRKLQCKDKSEIIQKSFELGFIELLFFIIP